MSNLRGQPAAFETRLIYLAVSDEEMGADFGTGWMVNIRGTCSSPNWFGNDGLLAQSMFGIDATFFVAVAEKQTVWDQNE